VTNVRQLGVEIFRHPPFSLTESLLTHSVRQMSLIETLRLRLAPAAPQHSLALIEGVTQFEKLTGSKAADGLREFFVGSEISPEWVKKLREATDTDPWVHGFTMVEQKTNLVIGFAGFKGPPNEAGEVEVAYGVVPGHQGRGYASEATEALVKFAFDSGKVRLVLAHTLPTPNASTKVLTKCGFRHAGEVTDPVDGLVWRWEREPKPISAI
jgi:ribosomal-protein-alanine N-acetyltransferase